MESARHNAKAKALQASTVPAGFFTPEK